MKNFFKTLSLILLLSLVWGAFAQGDFSIENKLETDTFIFGDYDENHRFPGIKETLTADYSSDKVDAKLEMSFDFFAYNQLDADYNKKLIIGVDDFTFTESYFRLRPIEKLQISFNSRDYVSGAYFPVMDRYMGVGKDFDSWDSGNYTGDIGFLFKPMDNLSLGAGINLLSYIVNKYDDTEENIHLNFGAEYELEKFGSIAVTLNDVANHFEVAGFAKITAIKNLDIYGGLSFQPDFAYARIPSLLYFTNLYMNGKFLLNAGLEYKGVDKLTLGADLMTNLFIVKDWTYDLYTGLKAEYQINDDFKVGGKTYLSFDFVDYIDDEDARYKTLISLYPEVEYKKGSSTFTAGLKFEFYGDKFLGAIPLSWKYSF